MRSLALPLFLVLLSSCGDDQPDAPDCQGDVVNYSLPPFSPCRVPTGPFDPVQQCVDGTKCLDGFCSIACNESVPCPGSGSCVEADYGGKFCRYYCFGDGECPAWLGDFVVCLTSCTDATIGCEQCAVPDEVCE